MICTLTINPAVDRLLYLGQLERNRTNRLEQTVDTVGGKGTHVSMNLVLMGQKNRAYGIAHGDTGRFLVEELAIQGVEPHFLLRDGANSRTNYLLVERGTAGTILAEKGVSPSVEELNRLLELMDTELQLGDTLILSGDASNCADPRIYNRILRQMQPKNLKVYLDSSGDTLRHCLEEELYLIKPNLHELSELCGSVLETAEELMDAISELRSQYPRIGIIAVSLGDDGAIVSAEGRFYRSRPPKVAVVNTIGCGDCFLAGMADALDRGLDYGEALQWATAVSAAAAESSSSVGFDPSRAKALLEQVRVETLHRTVEKGADQQ